MKFSAAYNKGINKCYQLRKTEIKMKINADKNTGIKSIVLCFSLLLLLCACSPKKTDPGKAEDKTTLPEKHLIAYDEPLNTLNDALGADWFNGRLDDHDSRYYVINDYYNMHSEGSLHILSQFETYQQTTEHSCGAASALMVLNYFGNREYDELEICELAKTDEHKGTSVEGLHDFFVNCGWKAEMHADTERKFAHIADAETFFVNKIEEGIPVMVDWEDWRGHWQVVIGIDTCDNESPYDDVVIVADPYDITDHYQDGYFTIPFGRFFDMWREGPCTKKTEPYEQPYVIATPAE